MKSRSTLLLVLAVLLAGCDPTPTTTVQQQPTRSSPPPVSQPAAIPQQYQAQQQQPQLGPAPPDVTVWWEKATIKGRLKVRFSDTKGVPQWLADGVDGQVVVIDSVPGPGNGIGGAVWMGNLRVPLTVPGFGPGHWIMGLRLECSGFSWGLGARFGGFIDTGGGQQMLSTGQKMPFELRFAMLIRWGDEQIGVTWATVTE